MISTASFSPPHAPTASDRREHRMLAEWPAEHAAAHRAGRSARPVTASAPAPADRRVITMTATRAAAAHTERDTPAAA